MAALARRLAKAALFACLFLVSMRYIHTYPLPITVDQQQRLIDIAAIFGVVDTEGFYLSVVTIVNLLAAATEYWVIMAVYRGYSRKP
jgi:hypothetical protein